MKRSVAIALVFIWIGFVCAISFMEAWLKFQAPGVSISIGLGIGRLVFGTLNKVEWVLFLVSMACLLPWKRESLTMRVLMSVICILLIVQTFWMLPVLDARAELYMAGADVLPSHMHFYYVALECVKVLGLILIGMGLLDRFSNRY